ncbi:hypothetical protein HDK77DRAFT_442249 [Phyllosticta capitalensis]
MRPVRRYLAQIFLLSFGQITVDRTRSVRSFSGRLLLPERCQCCVPAAKLWRRLELQKDGLRQLRKLQKIVRGDAFCHVFITKAKKIMLS